MCTHVKQMDRVFLVIFLLFLSEAVEGDPPPCKTVNKCNECPDLKILNGWVNDNKPVKFNRQTKYSCKDGFTLKGNAIRTCQQNGRWRGEQPVCNKDEESKDSDKDAADEVTSTSEMRTFDKTEDPSPEVSSTPSEVALVSDKTEDTSPKVSSTPSKPASDRNEASQDVAITVPVVIGVCVIAVIVVILLWRQKRKRSETTLVYRNNDKESSIAEGHTSERDSYTRTSDYAVIPPESVIQEGASDNLYQYIDILPEDQTNNSNNYDHMKQTEIQFVDNKYSHITDATTGQQFIVDKTYAHTATAAKTNGRKDISDEIDATYNQLNTQPSPNAGKIKTENQKKDAIGIDPTYNHGVTGGPDFKTKTDDYSHINSSRNKEHQYKGKARSTKYSSVQPCQFGSQHESQQYNLDNPISENIKSDQECDSNTDYEEAGGTAPNYFILEPESTSNGASFNVVGV